MNRFWIFVRWIGGITEDGLLVAAHRVSDGQYRLDLIGEPAGL